MTCDVFFYEAFAEEAAAIRKSMPPTLQADFTWHTIQESGHGRPPAAIVSIRTQSRIPPAWSADLDAVLSRSTGFDHLAAYRDSHAPTLPCGYLPLYCSRAVAEQAMLLWMALLRRLPRQVTAFSRFQRDGLTGSECAGKTLLVAGVGTIGREVVRIGQDLGMEVLGLDLVPRFNDVCYTTWAAGLTQADIVVCAMNLTPENRNIFNTERLAQLKPGAIFINIARGELADVRALATLLEAGHLGGVGIDVYADEPELAVALRRGDAPRGSSAEAVLRLARRDDAICTPHNAFNTRESVARKARQSIEQVSHFLQERTFIWPVPPANRDRHCP